MPLRPNALDRQDEPKVAALNTSGRKGQMQEVNAPRGEGHTKTAIRHSSLTAATFALSMSAASAEQRGVTDSESASDRRRWPSWISVIGAKWALPLVRK